MGIPEREGDTRGVWLTNQHAYRVTQISAATGVHERILLRVALAFGVQQLWLMYGQLGSYSDEQVWRSTLSAKPPLRELFDGEWYEQGELDSA